MSLARTLIAAGVVDELILVIAQKIAGSGRRLLDGLPSTALTLVESAVSPTGSLLLGYRISA